MPANLPDPPGVVTNDWPPAARAASREPLTSVSWSIALTASSTSLWPAQLTMLTATTNMDVRTANYTIDIWDPELGGVIASCSTGTTCSTQVTRANADRTTFVAVVGHKTVIDFPLPGLPDITINTVIPQAASLLDVTWHSTGLWLMETASTVPANGTTTLTAITDQDIGPSPFYVEIYDVTAGTLVAYCGGGTRCSVTVGNPTPPAATTHRYRACFTVFSGSFPPPNALECTGDHPVSWTNALPWVSLTVTRAPDGVDFIATALTPFNVGPTPYYIQIYNVETGSLIVSCSSGVICSTNFPPGTNVPPMVAYVALWSPTPPVSAPPGLDQSNSNTVSMAPPTSGQGAAVVSGPVIGPPGIPGGLPF